MNSIENHFMLLIHIIIYLYICLLCRHIWIFRRINWCCNCCSYISTCSNCCICICSMEWRFKKDWLIYWFNNIYVICNNNYYSLIPTACIGTHYVVSVTRTLGTYELEANWWNEWFIELLHYIPLIKSFVLSILHQFLYWAWFTWSCPYATQKA